MYVYSLTKQIMKFKEYTIYFTVIIVIKIICVKKNNINFKKRKGNDKSSGPWHSKVLKKISLIYEN